jgi:small subunit ribosomal protein S8
MRPSDSIADMLTRIRNACKQQHRYVDMPLSKIRMNIIQLLKDQGFVHDFLVRKDEKQGCMRVFIKYASGREPVIHGIKRISKPSCRRYVKHHEIPRVLGGMGIAVLSTSSGIMSGMSARKKKIGGEVLCYVW